MEVDFHETAGMEQVTDGINLVSPIKFHEKPAVGNQITTQPGHQFGNQGKTAIPTVQGL